jgi:hypothetical protein
LLVYLGQRHQLLCFLMRVGHRIGAQSKQHRKVSPAFLRPEIGLEDRGRVFAVVRKLGDAP